MNLLILFITYFVYNFIFAHDESNTPSRGFSKQTVHNLTASCQTTLLKLELGWDAFFLNGKLPEADLLGVWWCTPPGTEQHPNWEHPSVILPTPLKNGAIINIFTIKGGVFKPFIFFNWNSFQNITNSVQ